MYLTPIEFVSRKGLRVNVLPKQLAIAEPLLNFLGYNWSTHFVSRKGSSEIWAINGAKGSGRVGMSSDSALTCVVEKAISKIKELEAELSSIRRTIKGIL
jgi:hypothetical protein